MDDTTASSSSKAAIITGGATGVGRATALQLAGLGYDIAVVYSRSATEAEETVQEVWAATGRQALAIKADVAECIVSLITGSKLVTGQTLLVDSGMMIAGFQARIS